MVKSFRYFPSKKRAIVWVYFDIMTPLPPPEHENECPPEKAGVIKWPIFLIGFIHNMQIYGKFEGMICPSKRICLGWEYVPLKRGPGILPQLGSTRCLRGVSGVTYRSIRAVGSEDSPDMCLHTKNLKIAATFFFFGLFEGDASFDI